MRQHVESNLLYQAYLTDASYDWHVQTAYALGYIRAPTRARGIGKFWMALASLDYVDNRPESMHGTDQWSAGLMPARARLVVLSAPALLALAQIAKAHGITPYRSQRPVVEGRRQTTLPILDDLPPTSYASPCLESIGARWLLPTVPIPRAPRNLYATKRRDSEAKNVYTKYSYF